MLWGKVVYEVNLLETLKVFEWEYKLSRMGMFEQQVFHGALRLQANPYIYSDTSKNFQACR